MLVFPAAVATPGADPQLVAGQTIELMSEPGSVLRIGDDLFRGPLRIGSHGDGVTVTETLSPEDYLLGIREVPFAWPDEALKAQAVAARTYLAHTLASGPTRTARAHGYDICATTACQVYAGVAGLASRDGQRWRRAVGGTAGEILVFDGRPAQTLYSSTAGTRTRESEDIFPGLDVPYLSAVESLGEDSPFVRWSFVLTSQEMTSLLEHAGLLEGDLIWIGVEQTADGDGPWQVEVRSRGKVEQVPTYRFRTLINLAAAEVMPHRLPARRPDGRRYPQTILSGTFSIRAFPDLTITSDRGPVFSRRYVIEGEGWGHQVGMSQYGALAMAEAGAGYPDILAHYYGGLVPIQAGGWLPEAIVVGLVIGAEEALVVAEGGATVLVDGEPLALSGEAVWRFASEDGGVVTSIPVGIGQSPDLVSARIGYGIEGYVLRFSTTAPARVTILVGDRSGEPSRIALGLVEAGDFEFRIEELIQAPVSRTVRWEVAVKAESSAGSDATTLVIVPEIR